MEKPILARAPSAKFHALAALLLAQAAQAELVSVNPVDFDFGQIKVGQTVEVVVTIQNRVDFQLTLSGGGVSSDEFAGASGCAGQVAAGSSCTLVYSFRPSSAGAFSASTGISLSGNGQGESVDINMSGTGVEGLMDVYPVGIDFGDTPVGVSVSVPVVLYNSHDATITNFAGGGVPSPFAGSTNCGSGVAPGGSCNFTYEYTPAGTGTDSDQTGISISEDGAFQSVSFSLTGTGIGTGQSARVAPVGIDFGSLKRGLVTTVPVNIENLTTGTMTLAGGGIGQPSSFNATTDCGGGVASGGTCSVFYHFTPDLEQEVTASTSFTLSFSTGGFQVVDVDLSGQATGSLARVHPVTIDFGAVRVGETVTVPITILNDGNTLIDSFAGGAVASGVFNAAFGSGNCGALDPSEFCTIDYSFSPTATGEVSASTSFTLTNQDDVSERYPIMLSGTGMDEIFADGFEG